jgi:hypothetical protein
MVKVNEILMDIPLHDFILVFDEWKRRLAKCIDTGWNYLSTDLILWLALVSLVPKTKNMSGDSIFFERPVSKKLLS